jgi:hypothetical protein
MVPAAKRLADALFSSKKIVKYDIIFDFFIIRRR